MSEPSWAEQVAEAERIGRSNLPSSSPKTVSPHWNTKPPTSCTSSTPNQANADNVRLAMNDAVDSAEERKRIYDTMSEITAAAELDALPVGSIIRDNEGRAQQRDGEGWASPDHLGHITADDPYRLQLLPATVLHCPHPGMHP